MTSEPLECQDCGRVVKYLTPEERQQVVDTPYDFVIYCFWCQPKRMWDSSRNEA